MPITAITVSGYRSIEHCRIPVGPITVLVGENGVGKTNIYRALNLLQTAADGTITRHVAEEGGVESVLWAGAGKSPRAERLALTAEFDTFEYRIEIGLPSPGDVALDMEPQVKEEMLTMRVGTRKSVLMHREGPNAWLRDVDGEHANYQSALLPSDTALASFRDARKYPALEYVRRELGKWRFYHGFRTDAAARVRQKCLAVATAALASDGSDLAAALATVYHLRGDAAQVNKAVAEAFPDTTLNVTLENGMAEIGLKFPDQPRAFAAHELSDGTLRYLCLIGALCGYRMPGFIALNEPEMSLYPDRIPPLARLITRASLRSKLWVVTHSEALGEEIENLTGARPMTVVKRRGATRVELPELALKHKAAG